MTEITTIIPYHNTKRRKAAVTSRASVAMLAATGVEPFSAILATGGEFLEPSVMAVLSSMTSVSRKHTRAA